MNWIGRKFKCVYGLSCGDVVIVTSEPYCTSIRGKQAVDTVSCISGEEGQIEINELLYSIYWEEYK